MSGQCAIDRKTLTRAQSLKTGPVFNRIVEPDVPVDQWQTTAPETAASAMGSLAAMDNADHHDLRTLVPWV